MALTKILCQIWESYVEGEEVSNGPATDSRRQKEELKVLVISGCLI